MGTEPCPLSEITCMTEAALSELSVSVTEPESGPGPLGKLTLRLQLAPGLSDELEVQFGGRSRAGDRGKIAGNGQAAQVELGVADVLDLPPIAGCRLLVLPTLVAAKVRVGGWERWSSAAAWIYPVGVLVAPIRYRLPAPSISRPRGKLNI